MENLNILRRQDVERKTGLSRSTLYLLMAEGEFPESIQLGKRSVGWLEEEVDGWIKGRIEQTRGASK